MSDLARLDQLEGHPGVVADDAQSNGATNWTERYPTVVVALAELRRRFTNLRFCASRGKGKALEAAWQTRIRAADPKRWPVSWAGRDEYCIVPSTAGLFLVDIDAAFDDPDDPDSERKPTREEAVALKDALGGKALLYESTKGKSSWHILFADAANGGQDWRELKGATSAGFASANGLLHTLDDGIVLKFDTRGGGVNRGGVNAGKVNGARIDANRRRVVKMLQALDGGVTPIERPQVLADARAARKTWGKAFVSTAKGGGCHPKILERTAAMVGLPPDDVKAAMAELVDEIAQTRAERDKSPGLEAEREIAQEEAARAYKGAKDRAAGERNARAAADAAGRKRRREQAEPSPVKDENQFESQLVYDSVDQLVSAFNDRYACYHSKEARVIDLLATAVSDSIWPEMMSYTSFEQAVEHVKVRKEVNGEMMLVKAAPQWLKHGDRLRYKGGMEVLGPNERRRNPYAFPVIVSPPTDLKEGNAETLEKFLREIVCGGDEHVYEWLADWLADCVQRPHASGPGTAVLLTGWVGSGKSIVYDRIMLPILGQKHCAKMTDVANALGGGFNHDLMAKTLCFADEVIFERDRRTMQRLKDWCMAPTFRYERKFQDPITCRNTNRLLAATNSAVAAALEAGDRRFLVVETPIRFTDTQIAAGESVKMFKPYFSWFEANVAVMARWFMDRKVDIDRLRTPPITDAKKRAILGTDSVLSALAELAADGVIEGDKEGLGAITSGALLSMTGDRHMSRRNVINHTRELLGEGNVAKTINAYEIVQRARDKDGEWVVARRQRGKGLHLPTPKRLAELVNPRLPEADQIHDAPAEWRKWKPDATPF